MIWVLVGGTVSLVVALAGTPLVANYFRQRGLGQPIRDELRETHQAGGLRERATRRADELRHAVREPLDG